MDHFAKLVHGVKLSSKEVLLATPNNQANVQSYSEDCPQAGEWRGRTSGY